MSTAGKSEREKLEETWEERGARQRAKTREREREREGARAPPAASVGRRGGGGAVCVWVFVKERR